MQHRQPKWAKRLAMASITLALGVAAAAHAQPTYSYDAPFQPTPYHWSFARNTTATGVSGIAGTANALSRWGYNGEEATGRPTFPVIGIGYTLAGSNPSQPATHNAVRVHPVVDLSPYRTRPSTNHRALIYPPTLVSCSANPMCAGMADPNVVARATEAAYVSGVQVCTDGGAASTNVSIRGLRVEFRRVSESGAVTAIPGYEQHVSPLCSTWRDWQRCPDGAIAVDVVAHAQGPLATAQRYRGLALTCAAVQPPEVFAARTHDFTIDMTASVTVEQVVGRTGTLHRIVGGRGPMQGLLALRNVEERTADAFCGGGVVSRALSSDGRTEAGAALTPLPNFPGCADDVVSEESGFFETAVDEYIVGVAQAANGERRWLHARLGAQGGRLALQRTTDGERKTIPASSAEGEVTCPAQHVLTGLKIHTRNNQYVGYQLICSPVRAPSIQQDPSRGPSRGPSRR
jgi:hypothetical protein